MEVTTWSRAGLEQASAADSDRHEELLVNPAVPTLVGQRGRIDCGGLRHFVVRYGNFHQLVVPIDDRSHLSVALETTTDPRHYAERAVALVGSD
ncbi:hypothetical protein ACFXGI_17350 [Streptomyces sp. NPDC059355]|uniref:hypothetical protein n=1 Tax=Streptomyces sp. NPDC059355 TaxID=3346811 RepID=UPI0036A9A9E5